MADILTSKIQVPSLPDDTLILKDAEARNDLSTALATVTGNPLNFSTRSSQKAKETVISLAPMQDLHGYDHPWPAGGGKNKLENGVQDGVFSTITVTKNDDGSLTVNGTVSSTTLVIGNIQAGVYGYGADQNDGKKHLSNGSYVVSMSLDGESYTAGVTMQIFATNDAAGTASNFIQIATTESTGYAEFEIDDTYSYNWCRIKLNAGTYNNVKIYPMVRLSSETDPTFAPYSNICPISGHTEVNLLGTNGKESTDPDYVISNDLTKDLGMEVYGASYNPVSGELVVNMAKIILDGSQTPIYANWNVQANTVGWLFNYNDTFNKIVPYNITPNLLCDKYKTLSYNEIYNKDESGIGVYNVDSIGLIIRQADTTLNTPALVMAYLANNPIEVCYELATPITYHLSPDEISLLEGVNNISTDGDSIKLIYRDGKVATLWDLEDTANNLQEQIDQNEIMEDETTQLLYKLGVNNGLLFMEEV